MLGHSVDAFEPDLLAWVQKHEVAVGSTKIMLQELCYCNSKHFPHVRAISDFASRPPSFAMASQVSAPSAADIQKVCVGDYISASLKREDLIARLKVRGRCHRRWHSSTGVTGP